MSDQLKGLIIYLRACPEESRDEVLEHLKEKAYKWSKTEDLLTQQDSKTLRAMIEILALLGKVEDD